MKVCYMDNINYYCIVGVLRGHLKTFQEIPEVPFQKEFFK